MTTPIARLNGALFRVSAACGHTLWREQLALRKEAAGQRRQNAHDHLEVYSTAVWDTGWQVTCAARDALSRPRLDRAIGTGWDRGEGWQYAHLESEPRHRAGDVQRGRYDAGNWQQALAQRLGGSDTAMLATHLPFFLMRMTRHAGIAAVTGLAMSAGLLYGACVVGPCDTYRSIQTRKSTRSV